MATYLVVRFSAIGDVAMTIPVIYSAAKQNPDDRFIVLTSPFLTNLFQQLPSNVEVHGIDIKGDQRCLIRLNLYIYKWMKQADAVLDLHDVIRTKAIRFVAKMLGKPVYTIDKGRVARKALTRKENKEKKQLTPVFDRYEKVFKDASLRYTRSFDSLFSDQTPDIQPITSVFGNKEEKWIGIAPFAKHEGKIYPLDKMESLIDKLSKKEGVRLFLFGGGGAEKETMDAWSAAYPNVEVVGGKLKLNTELVLISMLDVMISMDSANMHFASLVGTPVVSIWGQTHPYAGFYGWKQDPANAVQVDLACRPCSIFGNKPCYRNDWACMQQISNEMILDRLEVFFS